MYRRSRYFLVIVNSKYALIQTYLYWFHTESFTIKNVYLLQNIDAPSDQSNNSSLTRYDQDHHRIRKRREKSTIILVSIVLIFLLCHMFRFSLKVNIIYRTRANKGRSWLVATPLTFQAKNYFSCFFLFGNLRPQNVISDLPSFTSVHPWTGEDLSLNITKLYGFVY